MPEPKSLGRRPGPAGELTVAAILLGLILSLVMGAANVYLGLRAGMTVSASIPAAVIAMGILQGIFRRRSILESNLVQTGASAGESLAAGIIFTVPALVLTGVWETFEYWPTTIIALAGGTLGVLLMIPMRRVFVVEHQDLRYPEGLACAEVLWAGQAAAASEQTPAADQTQASSGVRLVAAGILVGGVIKFAERFLGLLQSTAQWGAYAGNRVFYFGLDISPALLAVGYIVGLSIASQVFIGGAIGWLVTLPLLGAAPSDVPAVDRAFELWSTRIRYMGVGAMVVGGIVSIWRVRRGLRIAAADIYGGVIRRASRSAVAPSERNLPAPIIAAMTAGCVALIASLYYWLLHGAAGITLLTTAVMLVMSFFFAAVASYIVGLVGNSNSPVSGMTITVVLVTGALVLLFGYSGADGMLAMLGVAGVVCCVACTSGDVCNDLKTGHLIGASPRHQQVMQVLGVAVAAFILTPVMMVLHEGSLQAGTGGIGGSEFPAPQAKLFASLATVFFGDEPLHWDMVAWGAGIGVGLLLVDLVLQQQRSGFRLHVMPVAVGLYLPFGLAVPILLGGISSHLVARRWRPARETAVRQGVLISSGVIAGESLIGVLLGLLIYLGVQPWHGYTWLANQLALPDLTRQAIFDAISVATILAVAWWIYRRAGQGVPSQ
jgi:putative OPT family oligopeptide transporter